MRINIIIAKEVPIILLKSSTKLKIKIKNIIVNYLCNIIILEKNLFLNSRISLCKIIQFNISSYVLSCNLLFLLLFIVLSSLFLKQKIYSNYKNYITINIYWSK
jgi:hypothetical protein